MDHGAHRAPGSASTRRLPSACTTRTRPRSACSRRQSTCSRRTYSPSARPHKPRTNIHSGCQHEPTQVHRENATSASTLECNLGPLRRGSLVLGEGHGRDNLGSAARTPGHGRSRVEGTTACACGAQVKTTAETSCSTSGLILTSGFIFNYTLRESSVAPIIPPRERGSEHSTAVFRMRTRDGSSAAMRRARMHALVVRDLLFVAGG